MYEVSIYKNGQTTAPGPEIFFMKDWEKKYLLYTYLFLVKGGGKTMLVDTGCGDTGPINQMLEEEFGGEVTFDLPQEEATSAILDRENIDPGRVDYVFVSHLHHDHVSNVDLFPNARVVLSRKGWLEYMKKDRPYYYNDLLFPPRAIKYLASLPADRLILVEGQQEILPGIECFWVGGHTPCCMAVSVKSRPGRVVFPSDVSFTYRNTEENIPVGLNYNLWECYQAYQKIREKADILLPPHDPEVLKRFPDGIVK
ncbi:MAG: N-acyl homoserine lactonase family protein [Actinomycetota bacterium]